MNHTAQINMNTKMPQCKIVMFSVKSGLMLQGTSLNNTRFISRVFGIQILISLFSMQQENGSYDYLHCINTNDLSTKAADRVNGRQCGIQGCFVDGSSNDCSAVPGTCMLSYSNDQLALVNQCGVLSFHSCDSIIQYVAIYVPLGPSCQVRWVAGACAPSEL